MMYIPKTVFVDTNVFMDDLTRRSGSDSAKQLFELGVNGKLRICLSSLSVANIAYLVRKELSRERMMEVFRLYLRYFVIQDLSDMDVLRATKSDCPDFEDALQISCAQKQPCIALVTSNKKHFEPYTDMPVYTPDELLDKLTRRA